MLFFNYFLKCTYDSTWLPKVSDGPPGFRTNFCSYRAWVRTGLSPKNVQSADAQQNMAMQNAVADDEIFRNWYHYLHLQWSWRYSGRVLCGGNTTTIIYWVNFVVLEVDGIVEVILVKRAFSPAELGWWATLQATTIYFHSLWVNINASSWHNDWGILKLVFGEGQQSSSFSHPFCHWNYFLRLFYSIESTAVISVNL
jgi:hypothetical protein